MPKTIKVVRVTIDTPDLQTAIKHWKEENNHGNYAPYILAGWKTKSPVYCVCRLFRPEDAIWEAHLKRYAKHNSACGLFIVTVSTASLFEMSGINLVEADYL